jgi:hypothetical protein
MANSEWRMVKNGEWRVASGERNKRRMANRESRMEKDGE